MTRSPTPRAVVFDLDGTLFDSLPLVLAAIGHALEPFGARPTMEIFGRLGGPPERFLGTLLDDDAHVPVALERMEAYHRENAHLIQPYAGARDLLERLRAARIRIAVWTGRDRASTEWILREHRLDAFFDAIVCGDDLPTHKPDAAGLRAVLAQLHVRPGEALFVGDADVDVIGGVSCGVDTLLIEHRREVSAEVRRSAWRSVRSPEDAFRVVLECIQQVDNPGKTVA